MLCAQCDADLPRLPDALCPRCALPSPRGELCGRCLTNAPSYDATIAALAYEFPADALLHAFKFRGELALADTLAQALLARPAPVAERLVPVPLSAERLKRRGYNQALELARKLARATGVPLDFAACERQKDAAPQSELPLAERVKNVRGAFRCTGDVRGRAIAVVDDVMTTGATLDELAATLKAAGAARVVNWVVARTLPPR
ncbi:MAG: ComF family protein [Betaproteobacteria bacterium]